MTVTLVQGGQFTFSLRTVHQNAHSFQTDGLEHSYKTCLVVVVLGLEEVASYHLAKVRDHAEVLIYFFPTKLSG